MLNQSKANEAVMCYKSGFNCAQAVVSTYCEDLGMDKKAALQISSGFGAGMGRLQETCGAVSGACMLIGLKHGNSMEDDASAKEKTYAMVREFAALFKERNKCTGCRELLGVDLINGGEQAKSERVKAVCSKMVFDAAEIIERLLFSEEAE